MYQKGEEQLQEMGSSSLGKAAALPEPTLFEAAAAAAADLLKESDEPPSAAAPFPVCGGVTLWRRPRRPAALAAGVAPAEVLSEPCGGAARRELDDTVGNVGGTGGNHVGVAKSGAPSSSRNSSRC